MESEGGLLLVVDGDEAARDALCNRLREVGYASVVARDAREALDAIRSKDPDLAILDARSGAEQTLADMRAEKAARATPAIVLVPIGDVEAVERCLAAGADDFLFIPYSPALLRTQVRDYLRISSRRRQELRRAEREALLRIERDVQIARRIQAEFLPKEVLQPPGWEIAARFHPAREVAGDFYDVFPLTQGRRVGLVIADVCDKGLGAALFMSLFRSLLRAYSQQHYSMRWMEALDDRPSPGRGARQWAAPSAGTTALKNAMELTNDYISRNHADSDMFATVFFGVLDPATGQLAYANGGHNPPAIVGESGVKARLASTGPALGMIPGVRYDLGHASLDPGESLFMFTDGVADLRGPTGERFGESRLLEVIEQPGASAVVLLDRVDAALVGHAGAASPYDDVTMLAVRRAAEE